jgi:hypothetical protein
MRLLNIAVPVLVATSVFSAQLQATDGKPVADMDEQTLQEKYHIAPTKDGLLTALHHERAAVRSFAALKLASDNQVDALPPILAALTAETIPGVKIILAAAASQLGSSEGTQALTGMCDDPSWSPGLRMVAAQTMLNIGREGCLVGILAVLRSPGDDFQAPYMALTLIPRFKHVSRGELEEIKGYAAMYLRNRNSVLRMAAAHLMRELGDSWAISQLQTALAAESDESVRNIMASELRSVR